MTLRPHCLKCGSASIIRDDDVLNGRTSIYCAICGNRQYNGTDYIGFEMREGNMGIRAKCKNCERDGMSIIREGLCGTCAAAAKENPAPADRAVALAEVRARIERGELKGPQSHGPRKAKATKDPGGSRARYSTIPKKKLDSVRKGIRKQHDVDVAIEGAIRTRRTKVAAVAWASGGEGREGPQSYPKPEEQLGPGGDLPTKDAPPRKSAIKPIILQITFSGEDVLLYQEFRDYCRSKRRDPEGQILFLIDDIIRTDKALAAEFGPHS